MYMCVCICTTLPLENSIQRNCPRPQQIEANITRIVIRNNGTNMNVSNVCYVFIIIQTILGNVSSVIIVAKLKQSTS